MHARMIAFFIMWVSMKTLRNVLFVDSINLIVEKIAMMTRTMTEGKEGLKSYFDAFPSFFV
jgi:hypothetical protein